MTLKQFKTHLDQMIGAIIFDYKGASCGVDPITKTEYDIWYGDRIKTVNSLSDVLTVDLFDGKALHDVFDECTDFDY